MQLESMTVDPGNVVGETAKIKSEGYRFVTLSCVEIDAGMVDILYHFDRALSMKHLRMRVSRSTPIPSISSVYFAAFLVENEIQDLFGLQFQDLAIDYHRTLYLDGERGAPFSRPGGDASGKQ